MYIPHTLLDSIIHCYPRVSDLKPKPLDPLCSYRAYAILTFTCCTVPFIRVWNYNVSARVFTGREGGDSAPCERKRENVFALVLGNEKTISAPRPFIYINNNYKYNTREIQLLDLTRPRGNGCGRGDLNVSSRRRDEVVIIMTFTTITMIISPSSTRFSPRITFISTAIL